MECENPNVTDRRESEEKAHRPTMASRCGSRYPVAAIASFSTLHNVADARS